MAKRMISLRKYGRVVGNASKQSKNKERIAFSMGSQEKLQTHVQTEPSFKTKLIQAAGGYGGFQRKYNRSPFYCTKAEAKRLVGRNEKCVCGSGKKVKKCCLNR